MNDLTVYNEVKDLMKTGDLIQFSTDGFLSKSIQAMTRNQRRFFEREHGINVNHTAFVVRFKDLEGNRRYIPESLAGGASLSLLSRKLKDLDGHAYWYQPYLTDEERNRIGERALDYIGNCVPYGYGDLLRFAFSRPEINIENGLICSEYYMACLGMSGKAESPNGLTRLDIFTNIYPKQIV